MSKKERLKLNIEALKNIIDESLNIESYTGFGGIPEVLFNPLDGFYEDKVFNGMRPEITELYKLSESIDQKLELVHGSIISSIKNSTLTAFYTSDNIVQSIYRALNEKGFIPTSFLDPSAGMGVFANQLPEEWKAGITQVREIEKDRATAELLRLLRGRDYKGKVLALPFERFNESLSFDLIASNIPFGDMTISDMIVSKNAEQIHNYFLQKSMLLLNHGGVGVFLTSTGTMDSHSEGTREKLMKSANLVGAYRLPNTTFEYTQACCDLIILKRDYHKYDNVTKEEQAFINGKELLKDATRSISYNGYYALHPENIIGIPQIGGLYGNGFDLNYSGDNLAKDLMRTLLSDIPSFGEKQELRIAPIKLPATKRLSTTKYIYKPNENSLQLDLFAALQLEQAIKQEELHQELFSGQQMEAVSQMSLFSPASSNRKEKIHTPETSETLVVDIYSDKYRNIIDKKNFFFNVLPAGSLWEENATIGYVKKEIVNDELIVSIDIVQKSKLSDIEREQVRLYLDIKLQFYVLLFFQNREQGKVADSERKTINILYDEYIRKYGYITESKFLKRIDKNGFPAIISLENFDKASGQYSKAEIFHSNTHQKGIEQREDELRNNSSSLMDYFYFCLAEKLELDLGYISELSGLSRQECVEEFNDYIFYDFEQAKYVTKEEYLSGDVVSKMEKLAERSSQKWNLLDENQRKELTRTHEAIKSVQPMAIPFTDIDINLGQRWIPVSIYEDFAAHLFDQQTNISYIPSLEIYTVDRVFSTKNRTFAGVYLSELLQATMNGELKRVTKMTESDKSPKLDVDATRRVQEAQVGLQKDFEKYMLAANHKEQLEVIYNKTFNRVRHREYIAPKKMFENLQFFTPNQHQKDAAYMAVVNKGNYVAHTVGAGKTLTMGMTIYEIKQKRIANKPLMLALNNNIADIEAEIKTAYPDARLLVADDKNFTSHKRSEFLYRAAANDWDCVIMTHDNYLKLPHSNEAISRVLNEELDAIEDALRILIDDKERNGEAFKGKGRLMKGLEKRKESYISKLDKLASKKDESLTFQSIGFDFLIVDEADVFKNLPFTTRLSNIAGLSTSASQRALQLLYGVRDIQAKNGGDTGIMFSSGTPISNSIVELYLVLKYLIPNKLKKLGLSSFDGFQRQFCKLSQDYEMTVTGETKLRTRLSEYINLPELTSLWKEISHVVTDDDLGQLIADRPQQRDRLIVAEPTDEQREFTAALQLAIEHEDWSYIGLQGYDSPMLDNEIAAKMLLACDLNNKMAIDMRMISPAVFKDTESPKLNSAIKNIVELYYDYKEDRATQFVFLDIGTPNGKSINLYELLKGELVKRGIPSGEIAFIQEHKATVKRDILYNKVRSGEIRILFGSTATMGAGVNVQNRVIAGHHLTIPWRPRDLTQRRGRYVRRGNEVGMVHGVENVFYAVKNTLNEYRFNIIAIKEKFINQILKHQTGLRKISESSLGQDDDSITMSYAEMVAIMSGDKRLIHKSRLEKNIDELLADKKSIEFLAKTSKEKMEEVKQRIESWDNDNFFSKDLDSAEAILKKLEEAGVPTWLELENGTILNVSSKVGEHLKRLSADYLLNYTLESGKYIELNASVGNFKVAGSVITKGDCVEMRFYLRGSGTRLYSAESRSYSSSEPAQVGLFIKDALRNISRTYKSVSNEIESLKEKLPFLKIDAGSVFTKHKELIALESELVRLKLDLEKNPVKNPLQDIKNRIIADVNKAQSEGRTYHFRGKDNHQKEKEIFVDIQSVEDILQTANNDTINIYANKSIDLQ